MWNKFRQLWDRHENDPLKDFETETAHLQTPQYEKMGVQSIPLVKVVGSVGRAHELNGRFRYRSRELTERYQHVQQRIRQGVPMEPISVMEYAGEYYVVDGHHRVAQALQDGSTHINARVTRLIDAATH